MSNTPRRVLSGIQPTHDSFHLGNYVGAVKQWVELSQKVEEFETFYCVVDLHAMTQAPKPEDLRTRTLASIAQLLALGIDPDKSTLFVQSHVHAHNQLGWVMECLAGFGEASRMTQFKDKSQKAGADRTVVGLFTYPMLQAADILLYQAHLVPVGEDQRQHIEITRDLAERFNSMYCTAYGKPDTFRLPEGYILKAGAKIYDLQDPTSKMSKSSESQAGVIELMAAPEVNAKKIKSAVTDTGREVKFDEENKPGVSNLLTIYTTLTGTTIEEAEAEFEGKGYGDFKGAVSEVVVEYFKPIREKALSYLEDKTYLHSILQKGAQKASAVADETLKNVYEAMGAITL
jgi:tryptophanyl-tRNA synthetase